jgi:hypothetical protein
MTVIPIVSHQNTVSAVPTTLTTRTTPPASCPTSNSRPYNPYNHYNPTCRLYFLALTTIVAGLSAACHPPAAAAAGPPPPVTTAYTDHTSCTAHSTRTDWTDYSASPPRARQPLATGPPAARHGPASRHATGPPAARHGPARMISRPPASRSPRARQPL